MRNALRCSPMDELLTTAQVAERLGKSIATVNRMATDGRLCAVLELPGDRGARWYRVVDVEAYEATQEQVS